MLRSPLHQQIDSLPDLLQETIDPLLSAVRSLFTPSLCAQLERVYLFGCGDSHHAALNAALAFQQLAGLPCYPMTAMQFGRYTSAYLPDQKPVSSLAIAISVSGRVSRTIEGLRLAHQAGATAVALTGSKSSPLAQTADLLLPAVAPPFQTDPPVPVVPGARSYILSQLALYLSAVQIGQHRHHLTSAAANKIRAEIAAIAEQMAVTIAHCDPIAAQMAYDWQTAEQFVFCGSGPNYGTALFSAAKLLEASGDTAIGQDLEEWAHLQYFGRERETPTILISAGERDVSRVNEIAVAARTIGRRLALVAPPGSLTTEEGDILFPIAAPIRECFSPFVTSLPGLLFAAYRAQLTGEPYFRNFEGGRSIEEGGGISRIQSSQQWMENKV
ncbi:MAG: SIS domain-containing protein [Candidatus Promineifilaceae bacterium]